MQAVLENQENADACFVIKYLSKNEMFFDKLRPKKHTVLHKLSS